MKNHSRQYAFFPLNIILSILIVAVSLAACASMPPPTGQIAISNDAINKANGAGAIEFAPLQLNSAKQKMVYAEHAMQEKKYELANQLAQEAQVEAELALAKTGTAKAQHEANALSEDSRILRHETDRKTK
jgi:hypothetical protein